MSRPTRKTIKTVVEWLEEQSISLYGPNMDVDDGCEYPSLKDYTWEEAIKRYDHIRNDTLYRLDEDG